ncbi:hypothetical protein INR49_003268 [Caranx melampygus]|nr:hypothetical protein INR49_003268 [Caranx melampygus]
MFEQQRNHEHTMDEASVLVVSSRGASPDEPLAGSCWSLGHGSWTSATERLTVQLLQRLNNTTITEAECDADVDASSSVHGQMEPEDPGKLFRKPWVSATLLMSSRTSERITAAPPQTTGAL